MKRCLICFGSTLTSATAFMSHDPLPTAFVGSLPTPGRFPTQIQATVYNFGDDGSISSSWDEPFPSFSPTFSPDSLMEGLPIPESIRQNFATLTRLAAAFSPNRVALKDIHQVSIRHFDGKNLQLEAVVCDEVECVTLDVPVEFNEPCYMDAAIDACMTTNLQHLEMNAVQILKRHEVENEFESRVQEELAAEPVLFPDWWIPASHSAVADECSNILNLLNDAEFEESIQGVAVMALLEAGEDMNVEYATVAAVGPAGLIVRALARTAPLCPDAPQAPLELVKVPVPFASPPNPTDAYAVRDAVLALVAMASDYMP